MKFWVDEMPKSCSEDDCPFNYDTIACRALENWDRDDELTANLDGNGKRYSGCPLLLKEASG